MTKDEDLYQKSVDISTGILKSLDEIGTDPLTAMAALGNAWYRMCRGMQYPASLFREMCEGMTQMYEEDRKD
jgi:hypothetical protein